MFPLYRTCAASHKFRTESRKFKVQHYSTSFRAGCCASVPRLQGRSQHTDGKDASGYESKLSGSAYSQEDRLSAVLVLERYVLGTSTVDLDDVRVSHSVSRICE